MLGFRLRLFPFGPLLDRGLKRFSQKQIPFWMKAGLFFDCCGNGFVKIRDFHNKLLMGWKRWFRRSGKIANHTKVTDACSRQQRNQHKNKYDLFAPGKRKHHSTIGSSTDHASPTEVNGKDGGGWVEKS